MKPAPSVRHWKSLEMSPPVTRIPSMLTSEEKQYLTWLAAEKFEGWGAVVDLGPWLGGSTAALSEGLKRRGTSTKVHSFDLFQWEPSYMGPVAKIDLPPGNDFLPLFLEETADYAPWIAARKQDLMNYSWDDGPIEILFVGAAKSWEMTNAILRGFAPFLESGRSRIVLQNFRYYGTHWLSLVFDSRPDLWEETEGVEDGYMVTFMPLKLLTGPAGIQPEYSEEAFSLQSAERILRDRIAREEPAAQHAILRTLYRKYLLDVPVEEAQGIREEVVADGATAAEMATIERVEHLLVPRGWRAYNKGEYEAAAAIARRSLALSNNASVHALTLLGCSLFRAGDQDGARRAIDGALLQEPQHASARLMRAELAIAESRYREAEKETLDVIARSGTEELGDYALSLLSQIWSLDGRESPRLGILNGLEDRFGTNPSFLACLASEQKKAGFGQEARTTIERALALMPGQDLTAKLRAEWHALDVSDDELPFDTAAGRLHQPQIPKRSRALAEATIGELTSEVLARASEGSLGGSEEAILLGLEMNRALHRALDVHNNRFSRQRYADLFGAFGNYGGPTPLPIAGATIMDLGCGSLNPYGLLFLFLMLGARRGIAVDLDSIYDQSQSLSALADLAAEMLVAPGELVGNCQISAEQILRNIASFDLAKLRAGDRAGIDPSRLSHRRESVHALGLADAEVDLIVSNAFFEHIPSVEEAIMELARVTRPGGMGIHVVDGSDHRRYHNNKVHPLQFLTENHSGSLVHGSNRLRPAEFVTLFERHGFEMIEMQCFERAEVGEDLRRRLVEPFQSMSADHLAVVISKIVVRRCAF